jgi:predicted RNA-binding Zn-ribbon protein involved in translation (DUF1610 family)
VTAPGTKGLVYRCPVCGAELTVLATRHGSFHPVCCNVAMSPLARRLAFYACPVCGSEIAIVQPGAPGFKPVCCRTPMLARAA